MIYGMKRFSLRATCVRVAICIVYVSPLLAMSMGTARARQRAEIIPLPIDTVPLRINQHDEIAGVAFWDHGGLFLYKRHRTRVIPMQIFTSHTLVPTGLSINARGTVAGCIWERRSGRIRAFIWRNGKISFLSEASGNAMDSYSMAINDQGEIVGDCVDSRGKSIPCTWSSGHFHRLIHRHPGLTGDAFAINDQGRIAGDIDIPGKDDTYTHPTIWQSGKSKDLGLPVGYTQGAVMAINNRDVAVGWVYPANEEEPGTSPCVWDEVGAKALPVPADCTEGAAAAINNDNEIVGTATRQKGGKSIAMLWVGTKMFDLNSFLPSRSHWKLFGAYGINDAGDIVGDGKLNGQSRGYLLHIPHKLGEKRPAR